MSLMRSCERQTWYTMGWDRLAAEQERLRDTLDPQGEEYVPLLQGMLRCYAVLAQTDPSYIAQAAALVAEVERVGAPKAQLVQALGQLVQIYYHERKWPEGRQVCERLKQLGDTSTADRYLQLMKQE